MKDHLTKKVWRQLLPNKTADNVAKVLYKTLLRYFQPKIIWSDNGTEFKNSTIKNLLTSRNIKQVFGKPHCPKSQGIVERSHLPLAKFLFKKKLILKENLNIKTAVQEYELNYNTLPHCVTNISPNDLFNSRDFEDYTKAIENIDKYQIKSFDRIMFLAICSTSKKSIGNLID
jgi:transposase InsO family protein